jgi:hypothetical protein
MLEAVEGLPSSVVAITAKGRVTSLECSSVLRPMIKAALKEHKTLRLYYELHSRYPGAGWDELRLGFSKHPTWERAVVVSDTAWVRQVVGAVLFLAAKEVRVFENSQIPEAKAWVSEGASVEASRKGSPVLVPFRPPVPIDVEKPPRPGQPSRRGTHLYRRQNRR